MADRWPSNYERVTLVQVGQVLGRWTVVAFAETRNKYQHYWSCRCSCGTERLVLERALHTGVSQSCGCLNYGARFEAGQVVGELTVLEQVPADPSIPRARWWRCSCACGAQVSLSTMVIKTRRLCDKRAHGWVRGPSVKSGNFIRTKRAHQLHPTWIQMIKRCTSPKSHKYHRYGKRGIRVCDRWMKSFDAFVEDMGVRPHGHTLDRIDNDGNYEPGNVRWATPTVQANNREGKRAPKRFTIGKLTSTAYIWCIYYKVVQPATALRRIAEGWPPLKAFTTPLQIGHCAGGSPRTVQTPQGVRLQAEAARAAGLTPRQLRHRLYAGWTLERALTTPLDQQLSDKKTIFHKRAARSAWRLKHLQPG